MPLQIIGTSHIAQESVAHIQTAFKHSPPDLVAVELDPNRLYALLHPHQKNATWKIIQTIGIKGYLFAQLGRFAQQKLGKTIGMQPGIDMLTAVRLAQQHQLSLYLIDQDIQITLRNISKRLPWKEKFQFIKDLFHPPQITQIFKQNLQTLPSKELIRQVLHHLKSHYPILSKILVHERNQHMIQQLKKIQHQNPDKKILVVVGAGHEEELRKAFGQQII